MKYAISNIAWPTEMTGDVLRMLSEAGISGIEVAPSKVWRNTKNISFSQIEKYRKFIEEYDLKIVGLHSLLYDCPDLGLFKGKDIEKRTEKFLKNLIGLCADLGGRTLIFGSPNCRKRGKIPLVEAMATAVDFFQRLAEKAREEKVFFCVEPLGSDETDFINSAASALKLIKMVNNPGFQGHLDAKALYSSNEMSLKVFEDFSPVLKHFHVNEPWLKQLGKTMIINHESLGKYLREINYEEYVSIEQKPVASDETLGTIKRSVEVLKLCYKP